VPTFKNQSFVPIKMYHLGQMGKIRGEEESCIFFSTEGEGEMRPSPTKCHFKSPFAIEIKVNVLALVQVVCHLGEMRKRVEGKDCAEFCAPEFCAAGFYADLLLVTVPIQQHS
jgi:hypothetical protein